MGIMKALRQVPHAFCKREGGRGHIVKGYIRSGSIGYKMTKKKLSPVGNKGFFALNQDECAQQRESNQRSQPHCCLETALFFTCRTHGRPIVEHTDHNRIAVYRQGY
jgi:hypothetical protein